MPDQSFTPAEKMRLEARITIIEHLLMIQFSSDFLASGSDRLAMVHQFSERLPRALEIPSSPGLPPELSALVSGELGDQAHRMAQGIEKMVRREIDKA